MQILYENKNIIAFFNLCSTYSAKIQFFPFPAFDVPYLWGKFNSHIVSSSETVLAPVAAAQNPRHVSLLSDYRPLKLKVLLYFL